MGWFPTTIHYTAIEPRVAGVHMTMEEKVRLAHINRMHEERSVRQNKLRVKRALMEQYKKGIIDSEMFLQLAARMEEITDDLMALGNATGVVLGKKYVCGKLDREDFEAIKCDLVPASKEDEEKYVDELFKRRKERLKGFREHLARDLNVCQKCHRDGNFFSPLHELEEMILCKSCIELYERNKYFTGFRGEHIECDPIEIEVDTEPTCRPITSDS
jgi:hypothetical protein